MFLPPETASQETLDQSAGRASLRFGGVDLFPHASVTALYDDNVNITHSNTISDVEWTLSPGITVVGGDVSTAFAGSVTLAQLRSLLDYSLLDDSDLPRRFLGADYTPGFNFFTKHTEYDNVDQTAGLAAGYAFARLALGLNQDYSRLAVKSSDIGGRITRAVYDTKLRGRYALTDRSAFEVNLGYYLLDYPDQTYQGYQEVRNEDWFNHLVGARLEAGVGAAFGFVYPQASANQTYQQLLVRGNYRLSGKVNILANLGLELREYDSDQSDTLNPVFSLAVAYLPRSSTTFTLEGHRRNQPSYDSSYNYLMLGVSAGVRQQLSGHLYAGLNFGYENTDYLLLGAGTSNNRSDGYFSARVGLDYEFNRHLTGRLFYVRLQNDSNIQSYSYEDNLIGVQLSWSL